MIKLKNKKNGGYIALMSAIIISILLMTLSVTLSMTGFFARFDVLNSEYKERSIALAEGCVDMAMIKIAGDSNYSPIVGGEVVSIGTDTCRIVSVTKDSPSAGHTTIKTQGIFPTTGGERSYTNIETIINSTELTLVSWQEKP
jgi:hypothetical protein